MLFLATECRDLGEARLHEVPQEEQLAFEPGLLPLQLLCGGASGSSAGMDANVCAFDPLLFVDGPPQPEVDEGFQLFRVAEPMMEHLRNMEPGCAEKAAAMCVGEMERQGYPAGEVASLAEAVARVGELARRGRESGKSIFVRVLFR